MTVTALSFAAPFPGVERLAPPLARPAIPQVPAPAFSDLLVGGLEGVNASVARADSMVRAFALDDSIPVHQVTFALEQARLQMELAMQIRGRLVEAYQQLMNMQL